MLRQKHHKAAPQAACTLQQVIRPLLGHRDAACLLFVDDDASNTDDVAAGAAVARAPECVVCMPCVGAPMHVSHVHARVVLREFVRAGVWARTRVFRRACRHERSHAPVCVGVHPLLCVGVQHSRGRPFCASAGRMGWIATTASLSASGLRLGVRPLGSLPPTIRTSSCCSGPTPVPRRCTGPPPYSTGPPPYGTGPPPYGTGSHGGLVYAPPPDFAQQPTYVVAPDAYGPGSYTTVQPPPVLDPAAYGYYGMPAYPPC